MSNNKHTPTPWKVGYNKNSIEPSTGSSTIATVNSVFITDEECFANAKLIVKAVNMHEELLGVLDQIANAPIPFNANESQSWIATARKLAYEAIEKSSKL